MKRLLLFLFPALFSCSDKNQEIFLTQTNAVLESEISNLNQENSYLYGNIVSEWEKQGRPEKYQPLLDSAKITLSEYNDLNNILQDLKQKVEIDSLNDSEYRTCLSAAGFAATEGLSNNFKVMEIGHLQLAKSIDAYMKLKAWRDEIKMPDYRRTSPYVVISTKKDKIVRGEKYEARVEVVGQLNFKDSEYSAKVNGKNLPVKKGFSEVTIPEDSTIKMKPGRYSWEGEICLSLNGRDTIFPVSETYYITELCK